MNNGQFSPPPLPSFPFAPPPFGIPPPMPPPNFSGLTTDELRTMEGNERENIEARVKCLRNVQVLLDAAVMEMQQYTHVVSRLSSNSSEPQNLRNIKSKSKNDNIAHQTNTDKSGAVATNVNNESEEKTKYKTPEETGARPKVKNVLSNSEKELEDIISKMDNESSVVEEKSSKLEKNNISLEESKEADELR